MLDLSPETEALAISLAGARRITVDAVVREALVAQSSPSDGGSNGSSMATGDLATRRYDALRRHADAIAKLPDLDTRSAKAIMDDLNSL